MTDRRSTESGRTIPILMDVDGVRMAVGEAELVIDGLSLWIDASTVVVNPTYVTEEIPIKASTGIEQAPWLR